MPLDCARMPGIEFAVDQRMQQRFLRSAPSLAASIDLARAPAPHAASLRARASRDITVPTGMPDRRCDLAIAELIDLAHHQRFAKRVRPGRR